MGSPLPIAVATKKRKQQLQSMVGLSGFCVGERWLCDVQGIVLCVFTRAVSGHLRIQESSYDLA
jgi:hypothetical protein